MYKSDCVLSTDGFLLHALWRKLSSFLRLLSHSTSAVWSWLKETLLTLSPPHLTWANQLSNSQGQELLAIRTASGLVRCSESPKWDSKTHRLFSYCHFVLSRPNVSFAPNHFEQHSARPPLPQSCTLSPRQPVIKAQRFPLQAVQLYEYVVSEGDHRYQILGLSLALMMWTIALVCLVYSNFCQFVVIWKKKGRKVAASTVRLRVCALQYIFFTIDLENTKIDYFTCHKPPLQWGHYGNHQTVICMVLCIVHIVVL